MDAKWRPTSYNTNYKLNGNLVEKRVYHVNSKGNVSIYSTGARPGVEACQEAATPRAG